MIRYTPEEFMNYCDEQIESLRVAITRKSKGSTVEDDYFNEHLDKLSNFFNDTDIVISAEDDDQSIENEIEDQEHENE